MVQPFPKTYIANSNMKAICYNSDFHPLSFPNNVYFQQLSQYFILNCMCEIGVASEFLLSWGMCRKFEGCLYSYNKMLETVGFMKFNQSFNILEIYIYICLILVNKFTFIHQMFSNSKRRFSNFNVVQ